MLAWAVFRACPEAAEGRQDALETPSAQPEVGVPLAGRVKKVELKGGEATMATRHHGSKFGAIPLIHRQLFPTPIRHSQPSINARKLLKRRGHRSLYPSQFQSPTLSLAFHFGKTHKINLP